PKGASATARSLSCHWKTASASAPGNAVPKPFEQLRRKRSMSAPSPSLPRLGLVLSDDMLFTSRITGTARDLGLSVKPARSLDVLHTLIQQQTPQCVIVDLAHPGLDIAAFIEALRAAGSAMPRVIAYGSHVD